MWGICKTGQQNSNITGDINPKNNPGNSLHILPRHNFNASRRNLFGCLQVMISINLN